MPSIANLVHETATTTGTGNFTLTNANGKQSFNTAFGNGATTNVFFYFISNREAAEYEYGTGHMSAASTLVRDTVIGGTNGTSAVSFSAGTKDVTNDVPATYRREVLKAARTYYVRTDGSDSNTGFANTAGGAKLTLQGAWDAIVQVDQNGYTVTMQIADGTYTGALSTTVSPLGGPIVINGNSGTPANVVISTTSASALTFGASASVTVQNFKVQTTTSGNALLVTAPGVVLTVGTGMNFGACAGNHIGTNSTGSTVKISASYTISGGAGAHYAANFGSTILNTTAITVTLSGTPAFSSVFAYSAGGSVLQIVAAAGASQVTFSGSATGTRYLADTLSLMQTFGGGANFFPGNAAGSASTGGYYA